MELKIAELLTFKIIHSSGPFSNIGAIIINAAKTFHCLAVVSLPSIMLIVGKATG